MFDLEPTITLPWLIRLRWLFVVGQIAVLATLRLGFGSSVAWWPFALAVGVIGASNALVSRAAGRGWPPDRVMGAALLLDIVLLTVELAALGGATNPFTVMYLVYITLSAVVLSARWTTAVASAAIVGFALLFVVPSETHVHYSGPPILNPHLQGMWGAFVIAALLTAFFIRKISQAIAIQREQIASLRETAARNARLASLATLAAGAAHELNNPLSTIAVAAHEACLRVRELTDGAPIAADLDLILDRVDRCQQILHQLAARATAPEADDTLGADQLAAEIRSQLGARAGKVDIRIERELSLPGAPVVQSVVALVQNALDASGDGDRVVLAIRRDAGAVSIEVEDHGTGIPADVLAKVGEPFFTTKAPGLGLGLGVFLARVYFESLGGQLAIESTAGVGTRARARMPLEAAR
ncbi:MAG TPA: HAMP domain-containing sensor histidine kinase [Kofleriaceae bacterium]|nr:HAMP domain-containing sensor histidine kinase [Kofleriaceae bacterium]